ncbi:MAG TPA: hypothetical protein DCZ63_12960 [Geobacter sp.]|nr:hypothetical protein [Geobacter sp.]
MSKEKHTPGPWTAFNDGTGGFPCVLSDSENVSFYIAQCARFADARLLAAAPELLEACRAAEAHYAMICEVICANNPPPGGNPLLAQLRAAIAKVQP